MATIDSSLSTLSDIIEMIRDLTNRPSQAQITDDKIKKFVNRFILYDFPAIINALPLIKTLTFYLEPYIGTYGNNSTDPDDPLYNFTNKYLAVKAPVYVGNYVMVYFEDRGLFNAQYQNPIALTQIGTGDGVNTAFSGTLSNVPVQRGSVLFSSVDKNEDGLALADKALGLYQTAALYDPSDDVVYGTLDYVSGAYDFNFPALRPPKSGTVVYAQVLPYTPARPAAVLFYNNTFQFYPIPDQPYQVNVEVLQRPTEFLITTDSPEYAQWTEFIAYGAAIKILQRARDEESVERLRLAFKEQEILVKRKAIAQQTEYKTPTIFDTAMPFTNNTGWFYIK